MRHPTNHYLPAPFGGSALGMPDGTRWYLAPIGTPWPGRTVRQYADGARFTDPWPPDWAVWRTLNLGDSKVSFEAPYTLGNDDLDHRRPYVEHRMRLAPPEGLNPLLQVARLASARAHRAGVLFHPPRFQIGAESVLGDARIHVLRASWRLSADVTPGELLDLDIDPDTGNVWTTHYAGTVHV